MTRAVLGAAAGLWALVALTPSNVGRGPAAPDAADLPAAARLEHSALSLLHTPGAPP